MQQTQKPPLSRPQPKAMAQPTTEPEWQSFVLECNPEDEGCQVCDFLAGKRDQDTLMHVIKVLDHELGEAKKHSHDLQMLAMELLTK